MADEYINREAATMIAKILVDGANTRKAKVREEEVLKAMNSIPSIDVAPVVHGEWEENQRTSISERHREIHYNIYKCSRCNHANGRHKSNFCPYCGAAMRRE